jgi:hypothetical protein
MENTTTHNIIETPDSIRPLSRDLVKAARTLSLAEVRYLVGAYYEIRDNRDTAGGNAPHAVIAWLRDQNGSLEQEIRNALDSWTESVPAAAWAKSIAGIGPVISAGLAAHIDIAHCPTVGRIWRYAGLDPTVQWLPNTKRPWNAALKSLCWKIGESFVEAAGSERDFYGKLYLQRKAIEQARNQAGEFASQAKAQLERLGVGSKAEDHRWYAEGKLPPAHIMNRAKRWVVKLFLAHYHHVAWKLATGQDPPKPYVIAHLDHADWIKPPNFPEGAA